MTSGALFVDPAQLVCHDFDCFSGDGDGTEVVNWELKTLTPRLYNQGSAPGQASKLKVLGGNRNNAWTRRWTVFEHSLMSLDHKKPARRRWLSLPIAVGLHLAALATFTLASYWHVEGVGERVLMPPLETPVMVTLSEQPEGGKAPSSGEKPRAQIQKPAEPVQPDRPADRLPALETPSTVVSVADVQLGLGKTGVSSGVESTGGGGSGKGTEEGHGEGSGRGLQAAETLDGPIQVTGAVTRPVLLDGPQPRYTEMARRAGVQGTVVLEAIIDESGYVTNVTILKKLSLGLDQAAVEAVRSWHFKPATLAGRPVKVYYTLTANFTLQR